MATLRARPDVIGFAILAVGIRLAFWWTTGRIWEDGLITLASPRNAVEGLGLTHHAGEPVTHAFTSALGVLVPLVGEAISAGGGLLTIRLASLGAVIVAIIAADALGRSLGLGRPARALAMGLLAVEFNQIFYGMTGMETQIAVAALLVALWAAAVRHPLLGVAVGVAVLARPDFIILAGAIGMPLVVRDRPQLVRTVVGAAVVTVPWVAFTTLYYGSPIPQSILAKSASFTSFPSDTSVAGWLAWIPTQTLEHLPNLARTLSPFLGDTMSIGTPLPPPLFLIVGTAALVLTGIGIWVRRSDAVWTSLILVVGVYLVYRVLLLPTIYFDWYLPPFTATSVFLIGAALEWLARDRPRVVARSVVIAVALIALPLPWHFAMERTIQVEFEDGVRTPVSEELGRIVPPGDGVASESAGYIGWFSRVTLNDFPGLTSRRSFEVVATIPRAERSLEALIDRLRPPWAVLRPPELERLRSSYPDAAAQYVEVERFGQERTEIDVFGYRKATIDSAFVIVRRGP